MNLSLSIETLVFKDLWQCFTSALQCRLHCDSGYVSQKTPIVTCVDGEYEPAKPSTFICTPASALVISGSGDVEIFSLKTSCSYSLSKFHKFAGSGRTATLMDKELLLLGNDAMGIKGEYVSIHAPRNGLLAIQYSVASFPLRGPPHSHTALLSNNELSVIGGNRRTRAKLSTSTWTGIDLLWKNGSRFSQHTSLPCSVKVASDVHLVIGGVEKVNGSNHLVATVLKINTTDETVELMKPIQTVRMAHSCELVTHEEVLIAGGTSNNTDLSSSIQPDELYNITKQESVVLDHAGSLGRYHHNLVKMGEHIYALGGIMSDGSSTSTIAFFNTTTLSWHRHNATLTFEDTTKLVVTPFPTSSIDCVTDCQCGIASAKQRIFNGTEAQVRYLYAIRLIYCFCIILVRKMPTHGLLRSFEMRMLIRAL